MQKYLLILLFLYTYQCVPLDRQDAGQKLDALRSKMRDNNLAAYIIPSEDEHQSEYVARYDKRRQWISGFSGSAGVAVVTLDKAALWTDGRYSIAANQQIDKNHWILVITGQSDSISIEDWLTKELKKGDKVGQNAKLTSISDWNDRNSKLKKVELNFVDPSQDLIDLIWNEGRPEKPNSDIKIHDVIYAGKTMNDKMDEVIKRMNDNKADLFVVTALDEVAWLFNLRGNDIPYNPMFFAFGLVSADRNHIMYINPERINNNENLKKQLTGVEIREYSKIYSDLSTFSNTKKIWVSPMSSYAIYNAVTNKTNLLNDKASPVRSIKSVKNEVEINRTRECQIRDSIARVRHMHWLENEIKKGSRVTEVSSASKLEEFQSKDPLFRGLSFNSISAVGEHAADIHFSTSNETDLDITKNKVYLLDAGAQYEDCSTDITRTHHFGTPTAKEILAYTQVLQGSIDLAKVVFPTNVLGRSIDVVARAALWRSGLDYNHGTGHGIGYYLSIHEFPPRTRYTNTDQYDEVFKVGMFQSDEPGYYEPGYFGIRLETDIEVVKADTKYSQNYLTFHAQTLVPFDAKLINEKLLENDQVEWLNKYNERIIENVGNYFKNNNEFELYEFVLEKTKPFKFTAWEPTNATTKLSKNFISIILSFLFLKCLF